MAAMRTTTSRPFNIVIILFSPLGEGSGFLGVYVVENRFFESSSHPRPGCLARAGAAWLRTVTCRHYAMGLETSMIHI